MAMAMAVRAWEERARRALLMARRTRDSDAAKRRPTVVDQLKIYNDNMLSSFFAGKNANRLAVQRAALRQRRWGR